MNTKADKGNFAEGSIPHNILRMAGPMIVAQIIHVLYNLVDRMYIGQLSDIGRLALTGIGICSPALCIIIAFANLCGMGGGPLFSQARGRGNDEEAGSILGNSFTLLLIFGVVLTAVGYAIKTPLLYWLGADSETFPYANEYLSIYLSGSLMVMISLGMNPFINAQGSAGIGMMTVAIGAALNIILDPIFIFVFKMGVGGAALATVISQTVSAIWVLLYLTRKKTAVRLQVGKCRLQAKTTGRIAALGASGFCLSFTNSVVQMMYNTQLLHWGGNMYVSIMTIINSVREIFFAFLNGLTNGSSPVMSYNYGAGLYSRVCKSIRFITIVTISFCAILWVLVLAFPAFFIQIFNRDPDLLAIGTRCFRLYYIAIVFMAFQLAGQTVSTALGRAKTAIFFSLLRKVIIAVPMMFLLPHLFNLGVDGIFLSEPVSNVLGGLACWITMMLVVYYPLKKRPDEPRLSDRTA